MLRIFQACSKQEKKQDRNEICYIKMEAGETVATPDAVDKADETKLETEGNAAKIEELTALVARKDAMIKSLHQKTKEFLANVDKKWATKVEDLQNELNKANETNSDLSRENESLKGEIEAKAQEVEKLSSMGAAKEENGKELHDKLQKALENLSQEKEKVSELQKQIEETEERNIEMLQRLETSTSNRSATISDFTNTIESLRAEVSNLKGQLMTKHASALSTESELRSSLAESAAVEDDLRIQLSTAQLQVSEYRDRVEKLQTRQGQDQMQLESLREEVDVHLREIERLKRVHAQTSNELSSVKNDYTAAAEIAAKLEATLRVRSNEWQKERQALESSSSAQDGERQGLRREIQALQRHITQLEQRERQLHFQVADLEASREAHQRAAKAAEARAEGAEARCGELQRALHAKEKDGASVAALAEASESEKRRLEHRAMEAEATVERLRSELATMEETMKQMEQQVQTFAPLFEKLQAERDEAGLNAKQSEAEAAENLRKRLTAKGEVVELARQLEAWRRGLADATRVIQTQVQPHVLAITGICHSIASMLDPNYVSSREKKFDARMQQQQESQEGRRFSTVSGYQDASSERRASASGAIGVASSARVSHQQHKPGGTGGGGAGQMQSQLEVLLISLDEIQEVLLHISRRSLTLTRNGSSGSGSGGPLGSHTRHGSHASTGHITSSSLDRDGAGSPGLGQNLLHSFFSCFQAVPPLRTLTGILQTDYREVDEDADTRLRVSDDPRLQDGRRGSRPDAYAQDGSLRLLKENTTTSNYSDTAQSPTSAFSID